MDLGFSTPLEVSCSTVMGLSRPHTAQGSTTFKKILEVFVTSVQYIGC